MVSTLTLPLQTTAILYSCERLDEPLLPNEHAVASRTRGTVDTSPRWHASRGFGAGIVVQLCALSINYVFLSMWDEGNLAQSRSYRESVVLVVAWSLTTTALALAFLARLQTRVHPVHHSTTSATAEAAVDDFFDGALVGACTTLVVADWMCGSHGVQLMCSVGALLTALIWCHVSKLFFPVPTSEEGLVAASSDAILVV